MDATCRLLSQVDPWSLQRELWPQYDLYDKQREVMRSVWENDVTVVPAGNKLGKDFEAGLIAVEFFLVALKLGVTCRIVTTSVKEDHLDVLWGEIGRFLTTARHPLLAQHGGPLVVNSMEVRRKSEAHTKNPLNYLKGMVAGDDMDAFAGHHAELTLAIGDEASGLHDLVLNKFQGWAKRMLFIGNPNPCANFFRRMVKKGDVPRDLAA